MRETGVKSQGEINCGICHVFQLSSTDVIGRINFFACVDDKTDSFQCCSEKVFVTGNLTAMPALVGLQPAEAAFQQKPLCLAHAKSHFCHF